MYVRMYVGMYQTINLLWMVLNISMFLVYHGKMLGNDFLEYKNRKFGREFGTS